MVNTNHMKVASDSFGPLVPGEGVEGCVYSQLRTACKTAGVGNSLLSHLDQWNS